MEMNLSTILTVEEFITNSVCEIEMKRKSGPENFFLPQNRVWVVPGYQREIRWKAINVETLFENIYNSEKFLGTILISKTSGSIVTRVSRFVNEFHILKATCKFCTRLSTFVMTFPFFPLLL